ncbi:MAG: hypothetical protein ACJ8KO_15800 [Sulfurifustaceae bacterium]
MKLRARIDQKERQAEQARLALHETTVELRRAVRARLASRTAMALGFAGGWLLGWGTRRRVRRKRQPARVTASDKTRRGMPQNWFRSYFVWPFLLATARDFVVARRPSRREA